MSDAVVNELSNVNLATLIAIIILISAAFSFLSPLVTKLYNRIIKKYKKEQSEEDLRHTVEDHTKHIEEYENNRIHDREQSFKIQKQLTDNLKELVDRLDRMQEELRKRYDEDVERENKRIRADLKDRIGQYYRHYHITQAWDSMAKESLEDLIAEYEAAGGQNSFVHSIVEQEMYTWKLIDEE